jgi:hypothetical protein
LYKTLREYFHSGSCIVFLGIPLFTVTSSDLYPVHYDLQKYLMVDPSIKKAQLYYYVHIGGTKPDA